MSVDLQYVTPQILAQGLKALRENACMPRLVNRGYDPNPGEKGSTVDVPIPSAIAAQDVVPAAYAPAATDLSPTRVQVVLNQWKEAAFILTDKQLQEVMEGTVQMQITEASRAIANVVDNYILSLYTGIYNFAGTAGTTPFASNLQAAINGRRELARSLTPPGDRRIVLDEDAEALALGLEAIHRADYTGSRETYAAGLIKGQVMGADWYMDQNMPTHTAGTILNGLTPATKVALVNAGSGLAAGVATMNVDHTTLTGTVKLGDTFSFAGHRGCYVVTNASPVTASGNAMTGITFSPVLREAVANNEEVTFNATHVVNLEFHRDAIALATRPLEDTTARQLNAIVMSAQDAISGLSMRVEVMRGFKQTRWSFDILYGAALVRPGFAARIMG